MSGNLPSNTNAPWLQTRLVRSRMIIEHDTPYVRKFTEEIIVLNTGSSDVRDLPIPLTDFKHGLQVLDYDNSVLSYYSRTEIEQVISTLERPVYEIIERQLTEGFLLWLHLPEKNMIKSNEVRTIRLVYRDPESAKIPTDSLFDNAEFGQTIIKHVHPDETFLVIYPPKDFVIDICKKETNVKDLENKSDIVIDYCNLDNSSFKSNDVTINNKATALSARFPAKENPYKVYLNYQIKLSFLERWIWRIVLPVSGLLLLGLIIWPSTSYAVEMPIKSDIMIGIGSAVTSVSGAMIALLNNPLVRRTRTILFVHIGLSIFLIIRAGGLT